MQLEDDWEYEIWADDPTVAGQEEEVPKDIALLTQVSYAGETETRGAESIKEGSELAVGKDVVQQDRRMTPERTRNLANGIILPKPPVWYEAQSGLGYLPEPPRWP